MGCGGCDKSCARHESRDCKMTLLEKRISMGLKMVTAAIFSVVLFGCKNDSKDVNIIQMSQPGNYVVSNVSTGQTLNVYTLEDESTMLNAKNGDIIRLQYVPDKDYAHLNYHVSFTLHDKSTHTPTTTDYSYEYNIKAVEVGSYPIMMSALINEDGVQVTSFASFTLVIKE